MPLPKLRFPGRNIVFLLIIGTLMIPNQTILFPFYQNHEFARFDPQAVMA